MTKLPIDGAPAGPALDAAVAEALGWRQLSYRLWHDGDDRERWIDNRDGAWSPSTDIAAAWEVHRAACAMLFSKRRMYFEAIQEQTRLEDGSLVAWPDVLVTLVDVFLEAVCRAFLKTKGVEFVEVPDG